MPEAPHVVILGAGFAGLWAARALARSPVRVTLIDRANYHTFFPLLYQVAAAELEPEDIAYPVRSAVRPQRNARFVLAEAQELDLERRALKTPHGEIAYDYLVVAIGSRPQFFGVPGAHEHAFVLRTLEEGVLLRNHVLACFEEAAQEPDPARRRSLLTFAVVGGGPTGVEFAGALAELVNGPLRRDFRELDAAAPSILLIEAEPSVLHTLGIRLQRYAARRLQRMGIAIRAHARVSRVTADSLALASGEDIPTRTVVWTAGVCGDARLKTWGLPLGPGGRVAVSPTLQVPHRPEVYVAGDAAALAPNSAPVPMVAPAAMQQGEHAARNIARQLVGLEPIPFRYRDPGTLAVIGRNAAVAHVWRREFTGFIAWVLWVVVHLARLIGFRNRLMALTSWALDYLLLERAVRLILPSRPS